MSVKTQVLSYLEAHRGDDISGETLAAKLGVSRAAVWKAIKVLKAEGHFISAGTNRGYRLLDESDILSAEGISHYLTRQAQKTKLFVFGEIDSTNLEAKRQAISGEREAALIVSDSQTIGRGRFGRSFFSPSGCGIYMSILFYPTREQLCSATLITIAAAVAVCRAIERLTKKRPEIKWVNDIYLDNKKICGILTEAVSDIESGAIESIVVGLGINFKKSAQPMPNEISSIVGTIFENEIPNISRNELAAQVANELFELLSTLSQRNFLDEYRSHSLLLGKEIVFLRGEEKHAAIAESINDDGALVVRYDNGSTEALCSGEVSVRPRSMEATLPSSSG